MNNFKEKHTRVILSYYWKFRSFPDYAQQLEMESLGKKIILLQNLKKLDKLFLEDMDQKLSIHIFNYFIKELSKYVQILLLVIKIKMILNILKLLRRQGLSEGAEGLEENEKINGNVPVNLFILKKNNSMQNDFRFTESLGYLIATWEHRTFITATMLGINPFDQFGVNAGKKYTLARKFIKDSS